MVTKDKKGEKIAAKEVVVAKRALLTMALHGVQHSHESIYGILIGQMDTERCIITVDDAVPVSHGAPTLPIVEAAIGLIQAHIKDNNKQTLVIVGCYTAPMLIDDDKASPAALRLAASLATGTTQLDPTLIVLKNRSIVDAIQNEKSVNPDNLLQCYGRDFGNQWLEPITGKIKRDKGDQIGQLFGSAISKGIAVNDLVDHLVDPISVPWYPNSDLSSFLS